MNLVNFSITYNGTEDASSEVRVLSNGLVSAYTFAVQGIFQAASSINLSVYPNPAEGWGTNVSMDLPQNGITSIEVYDLMGNHKISVYNGYLVGYQNQYINTASLTPGNYIVKVVSDYGLNESIQFVVQ